jgi:transcription initiation factor TFIIF subunit alpha
MIQSEEESNPEVEEEKKDGKPGEQSKINGEKSGASTKGENTPSDRKKHLRMGTKRPGSPNLSEASGNESTRKKAKLNFLRRAADMDASGASGNESAYKSKKHISTSTARGAPKALSTLASLRSGSGSESESVRRSRAKNLSARGTPVGSRAQSPSGAKAVSKPPTRAASPDGGANSPPAGPSRSSTPAAGAQCKFVRSILPILVY